ncbi:MULTISPECIES: sigma-54-dependent Fis family transcriptional regulator [Rhodomicrobium]|uniref:sigma-54-dependent Fis family transcriptional regulator n=1 Tax=Rhodomicrobium TaxID=1068 RepID=UPI000B4AA940|nr:MULTISPECIES: sigma-54-dependent Fis family transcriptional regulator [Rhodomicrobium]
MGISDTAALRAHGILQKKGKPSAELLSADIYQSWQRCLALGLDPRRPPAPRIAEAPKLQAAREKSGLTRKLALAELHGLHEQFAGTSFMIAFADADCLLLDVFSDPDFMTTARAAGLQPGGVWSEDACGTNALGSAAFDRRPMIVHGAEHFFVSHLDLTCIAHPVFSPDGALAGVIDASSYTRSRQYHTQVLVRFAATQIENGLFRDRHRDDSIIAFHHRSEYLNSLTAGLLALRSDGCVVGANKEARSFLHGRSFAEPAEFEAVFATGFDAVFRDLRQRSPVRLKDRAGASFFAVLDPLHRREKPPPIAIGKIAGTVKPGFVADDERVATIVARVEAAAARKLPILIRGETGTGKELLARHAHTASGRKGAFVPVNCAALPDSLIEAELFGYAEGAFTGARRGGSLGLVCEADGGTLFLDEIGDLPMPLQAVLLRLLDDWTVRPIGGQRRTVDVQLVSATNVKLDAAIAAGRFRSDLLYRMNTLEVSLPSLAGRGDIEAIARHLLASHAPGCKLTQGAVEHLASHDWPGNIRELRNELLRASLGAIDGVIDRPLIEAACERRAATVDLNAPAAAEASLRDLRKERVRATLAETGGNISLAARRLGVSRNTVYRIIGAGIGAADEPADAG